MPRGERESSKRARPKPVSSVPAVRPASSVAQPAPKQPGLFGQMVSTTAGVAIGSTVVGTCTLHQRTYRKTKYLFSLDRSIDLGMFYAANQRLAYIERAANQRLAYIERAANRRLSERTH